MSFTSKQFISRGEGLLEVGFDVINMFCANGDTKEVLSDTGCESLIWRELFVCS
jgi:hypothetical protein